MAHSSLMLAITVPSASSQQPLNNTILINLYVLLGLELRGLLSFLLVSFGCLRCFVNITPDFSNFQGPRELFYFVHLFHVWTDTGQWLSGKN